MGNGEFISVATLELKLKAGGWGGGGGRAESNAPKYNVHTMNLKGRATRSEKSEL